MILISSFPSPITPMYCQFFFLSQTLLEIVERWKWKKYIFTISIFLWALKLNFILSFHLLIAWNFPENEFWSRRSNSSNKYARLRLVSILHQFEIMVLLDEAGAPWFNVILIFFGCSIIGTGDLVFLSRSRKLHYNLRKSFLDQYCSLLTLLKILIYEVCRKFDKNCIKTSKKKKVLGLLSFSVSIWDLFDLKNSNYLFGKAYWTANTGHFDRFQHSNQRSLTKIPQKLHKSLKSGKFWNFGHSLGQFSLTKPQLSLDRKRLDNNFVPCLTFSTF